MHQPLPKIAPKIEPITVPDASTAIVPRPAGAPLKVVFVVLIGLVVAVSGSTLPVFHRQAPVKPVTLGKIAIDPDGDDPRTVLLYHWQDPRFAAGERKQIIWMVDGLSLLGIWSIGKRLAKEPRR